MAREYTPNLDLDLYSPCDKPNLRDQYNTAMRKLDNICRSLREQDILFSTQINSFQVQIEQVIVNMQEADENIDDLLNRLTIVENELPHKAPVYHASPDRTYGVGDNELFGHLKLTDDWQYSADNYRNGVAATPYAVREAFETLREQMTEASNESAAEIFIPNPDNGNYWDNQIFVWYRHGVCTATMVNGYVPDYKWVGRDSDRVGTKRSIILGSIPVRFAPKHTVAVSGDVAGGYNRTWAYQQLPEFIDGVCSSPFVFKVNENGLVIGNWENQYWWSEPIQSQYPYYSAFADKSYKQEKNGGTSQATLTWVTNENAIVHPHDVLECIC